MADNNKPKNVDEIVKKDIHIKEEKGLLKKISKSESP
tara:strand:+ start:396 stop:506 length:111 start_codon:yes stop_codon:yes gene_type:complete